MGRVVTNFSMSLDGYIAGVDENFQQLFKWYGAGDTEFVFDSGMAVKIDQASVDLLQAALKRGGAIIIGRRLFDITNGWNGNPPIEVPVFVVTHTPPDQWEREGTVPYTFVTEGVEAAIQQAQVVAGEKDVVISSASIAQQAIRAGLLDEISLDLVPFILGDGVPLFEHLGITPIELEQTDAVVTPHVTHLSYRIVKA